VNGRAWQLAAIALIDALPPTNPRFSGATLTDQGCVGPHELKMRDVPTLVKWPTLCWTVTNTTNREALVHEYVPVMAAHRDAPHGATLRH
jgi:hypothetical protein